jgi:chromosome segregation ATPase
MAIGSSDEATEILRLIWQEMKALNGRIDQTNARLDQTNARLDQTNARLEVGFEQIRAEFDTKLDELRRQMVEADVRVATAVTDLSKDVRALTAHLRETRPGEARLSSCETEIRRLDERVTALEAR